MQRYYWQMCEAGRYRLAINEQLGYRGGNYRVSNASPQVTHVTWTGDVWITRGQHGWTVETLIRRAHPRDDDNQFQLRVPGIETALFPTLRASQAHSEAQVDEITCAVYTAMTGHTISGLRLIDLHLDHQPPRSFRKAAISPERDVLFNRALTDPTVVAELDHGKINERHERLMQTL